MFLSYKRPAATQLHMVHLCFDWNLSQKTVGFFVFLFAQNVSFTDVEIFRWNFEPKLARSLLRRRERWQEKRTIQQVGQFNQRLLNFSTHRPSPQILRNKYSTDLRKKIVIHLCKLYCRFPGYLVSQTSTIILFDLYQTTPCKWLIYDIKLTRTAARL